MMTHWIVDCGRPKEPVIFLKTILTEVSMAATMAPNPMTIDPSNGCERIGEAIPRSGVEVQMTINSKYIFVASMDVDADKEALFNEVYDIEHIPNLLKVPGVHAATRIE